VAAAIRFAQSFLYAVPAAIQLPALKIGAKIFVSSGPGSTFARCSL
jgi:hypothetical protein